MTKEWGLFVTSLVGWVRVALQVHLLRQAVPLWMLIVCKTIMIGTWVISLHLVPCIHALRQNGIRPALRRFQARGRGETGDSGRRRRHSPGSAGFAVGTSSACGLSQIAS